MNYFLESHGSSTYGLHWCTKTKPNENTGAGLAKAQAIGKCPGPKCPTPKPNTGGASGSW